ncbi:unnamed protein product [Vitrella brassicaformis CCMP3155]|uniref:Peroxisomal membrane protein MPV17 n=2 Tax=Vitrella brassicaformis TaxID=1169539 RepID=A0A0G4G866_VITBC|nr:unnamed protein product [Vitrella brassicaformis CCMP3155]|eukprot:CEM24716.1 unnamed protein product [Vitrella brassicaformis CCMP3155]
MAVRVSSRVLLGVVGLAAAAVMLVAAAAPVVMRERRGEGAGAGIGGVLGWYVTGVGGFLWSILVLLNKYLTAAPLLANAMTAALFCWLGDLIGQYIGGRRRDQLTAETVVKIQLRGRPRPYAYDVRKALIFTAAGATSGVFNWVKFAMLERVIGSSTVWQIAASVACDQLICAPLANWTFLVWCAIWERAGGGGVTRRIVTAVTRATFDVAPLTWSSLKVWPAVVAMNLWLVPVDLRVLFISCVVILWNVFLSLRSSSAAPASPHPPAVITVTPFTTSGDQHPLCCTQGDLEEGLLMSLPCGSSASTILPPSTASFFSSNSSVYSDTDESTTECGSPLPLDNLTCPYGLMMPDDAPRGEEIRTVARGVCDAGGAAAGAIGGGGLLSPTVSVSTRFPSVDGYLSSE